MISPPLYKLLVITSNILGTYRFSVSLSTVYYVPHAIQAYKNRDVLYLTHHTICSIISILATFTPYLFLYKTYFDCMTLLDITGIFTDIHKRIPRTVETRKALAIGYVPIRCIVTPYVLLRNPSFDTRSFVCAVGYWGLVIGSYMWSYQMFHPKKFKCA